MTDQTLRGALGRYMAFYLDQDPELAAMLAKDSMGRTVLVPALLDDPLHRVIGIVGQAGGNGSVVVAEPIEDGFRVVILTVADRPIHDRDDDCHLPIGPQATIGDMIRILTPGASLTVRVDHGELVFNEDRSVPVAQEQLLAATA